MLNLRYRSHRIIRDFFETGSRREIVDWKAYGYNSFKNAYETLRVSCEKLEMPVYVSSAKKEITLFRLDI